MEKHLFIIIGVLASIAINEAAPWYNEGSSGRYEEYEESDNNGYAEGYNGNEESGESINEIRRRWNDQESGESITQIAKRFNYGGGRSYGGGSRSRDFGGEEADEYQGGGDEQGEDEYQGNRGYQGFRGYSDDSDVGGTASGEYGNEEDTGSSNRAWGSYGGQQFRGKSQGRGGHRGYDRDYNNEEENNNDGGRYQAPSRGGYRDRPKNNGRGNSLSTTLNNYGTGYGNSNNFYFNGRTGDGSTGAGKRNQSGGSNGKRCTPPSAGPYEPGTVVNNYGTGCDNYNNMYFK